MGIFKNKCPKCWEPYPCNCQQQGSGVALDNQIKQLQREKAELKEEIERLRNDL